MVRIPRAVLPLLCLLAFSPPAQAHRRPRLPSPPLHPRVVQVPVEDPTGHSLDAFGAALERARTRRGQARIAVWGASHTAGDLYTGLLRRELQARYGDAGHGFIQAGHPWRYFRHSDVNVASSNGWVKDRVEAHDEPCAVPAVPASRANGPASPANGRAPPCPDRSPVRRDGLYGLAGVSVRSSSPDDWTRFSTTRDNAVGRRASTIEAWFLRQPGGGSFDVRIDGRLARTVATAGDAHAPGCTAFRLADRGHTVELRPRGDGEVRLFGIVMERAVPGVILDTLGIPGSRAEFLLKWDPALFLHQVQGRRPDLVVLAYGTNEAGDDHVPIDEYERWLHEVVTRVRHAAPQASCLLIGPTDRPLESPDGTWLPRPRRAEVTAVQRRVAFDRGCAFFDAAAMMGGEGGMDGWVGAQPPLASRDHVHLTREGYEIMGRMLLRELLLRTGQATP